MRSEKNPSLSNPAQDNGHTAWPFASFRRRRPPRIIGWHPRPRRNDDDDTPPPSAAAIVVPTEFACLAA